MVGTYDLRVQPHYNIKNIYIYVFYLALIFYKHNMSIIYVKTANLKRISRQ